MSKAELPKQPEHAVDDAQAVIDAIIARYGDVSPKPESSEAEFEQQVIVPIAMWGDLEWLEGGPINDAVQAASFGGDGYAEGEEMGEHYIFFCGHVDIERLRLAVQNLIDDRRPSEFTATVASANAELVSTGRDKVVLVARAD